MEFLVGTGLNGGFRVGRRQNRLACSLAANDAQRPSGLHCDLLPLFTHSGRFLLTLVIQLTPGVYFRFHHKTSPLEYPILANQELGLACLILKAV